ncbi:MAG: twin-arginine translocation signal domain-containing protein [Lachnospiraceae bacterium]|nr:twin-arginine translocation signal domain-containing protein [Lachnospiraceae bacterium]
MKNSISRRDFLKGTVASSAALLTMSMALGTTAAAEDDTLALSDILSIDGKTGKIYLERGDYNYPLKYLYDVSFWYAQDSTVVDPTLGYILNFLSTGRLDGDTPRVDIDAFVNSALGEKTAEIWYIHMLYSTAEQMNEGLVNYWAQHGLLKEAYYVDDTEEAIACDYYVYSPTQVEAPEAGYPLIILYHGGGEAAYQTETFGFCQIAAEEGIILAAPESTGDADSTNAIIASVSANYNVDTSRVYVVGSSGGGSNAMSFSLANQAELAGVGIMDQPVTVATRWYAASDEELAQIGENGFNMVYVGGTADMYGLYGTHDQSFFETSEGAEDQFISGWNSLMAAYGVEGKDITSRLDFVEDPANEAEQYAGYPFDTVEDIDKTGTSPIWKCTMDGVDTLTLYLVYNRCHMPAGYDAENIWSSLSKYRRNLETGMLEEI